MMQCPILTRLENVLPSTDVPMHDKTPDRKALNGNVPTIAMYTTCKPEPLSASMLLNDLKIAPGWSSEDGYNSGQLQRNQCCKGEDNMPVLML